MELSRPPLVVAFELSEKRKAIVADALAGASAVVYLTELDEAARAEALRDTGALLTFNTSKELRPGEAERYGADLARPRVGDDPVGQCARRRPHDRSFAPNARAPSFAPNRISLKWNLFGRLAGGASGSRPTARQWIKMSAKEGQGDPMALILRGRALAMTP